MTSAPSVTPGQTNANAPKSTAQTPRNTTAHQFFAISHNIVSSSGPLACVTLCPDDRRTGDLTAVVPLTRACRDLESALNQHASADRCAGALHRAFSEANGTVMCTGRRSATDCRGAASNRVDDDRTTTPFSRPARRGRKIASIVLITLSP